MKTLLTILILILILTTLGCVKSQTVNDGNSISSLTKQEKFNQVIDFPTIKDSVKFISELRQTFNIMIDDSPFQKANEKITTYKKVKINGSDNDFIFIEYDYGDGCMASYPWKYQLLLTTDGTLIKLFSGQRFKFVVIFPDQNPFLMIVTATAKGNGGHEIYKISADTLKNIYEGYFDYGLRTYDAHEDSKIYEPHELIFTVKDFNNDGLNDISFSGEIVLIQGLTNDGIWYDREIIDGKEITYSTENQFKKIPVEFIFLYDKKTGHFKAKENYNEKYRLDN